MKERWASKQTGFFFASLHDSNEKKLIQSNLATYLEVPVVAVCTANDIT